MSIEPQPRWLLLHHCHDVDARRCRSFRLSAACSPLRPTLTEASYTAATPFQRVAAALSPRALHARLHNPPSSKHPRRSSCPVNEDQAPAPRDSPSIGAGTDRHERPGAVRSPLPPTWLARWMCSSSPLQQPHRRWWILPHRSDDLIAASRLCLAPPTTSSLSIDQQHRRRPHRRPSDSRLRLPRRASSYRVERLKARHLHGNKATDGHRGLAACAVEVPGFHERSPVRGCSR